MQCDDCSALCSIWTLGQTGLHKRAEQSRSGDRTTSSPATGLASICDFSLGQADIIESTYSKGTLPKHLPQWLSCKEPACNAEDTGSVPALGRSPGEGNGNPLQYSCMGNSLDRGACWPIVCGVTRVRHDLVTKQQQKPRHYQL